MYLFKYLITAIQVCAEKVALKYFVFWILLSIRFTRSNNSLYGITSRQPFNLPMKYSLPKSWLVILNPRTFHIIWITFLWGLYGNLAIFGGKFCIKCRFSNFGWSVNDITINVNYCKHITGTFGCVFNLFSVFGGKWLPLNQIHVHHQM